MSRRYCFAPRWIVCLYKLLDNGIPFNFLLIKPLIYADLAPFPQSEVVERHFHDLVQRYGETIAIDLTDKVRFSLSLNFHFEPALYYPFSFLYIRGMDALATGKVQNYFFKS